MTTDSPGEDIRNNLDTIRAELLNLIGLTEGEYRPPPNQIHRDPAFQTGPEWEVEGTGKARLWDEVRNCGRSRWSIRTFDDEDEPHCVYFTHPDSLSAYEWVAMHPAEARAVARALLAAADWAERARADDVSQQRARRANRRP